MGLFRRPDLVAEVGDGPGAFEEKRNSGGARTDRDEVADRAAAGPDEAQAVVRRITGQLAALAERAVTDADGLLANTQRAYCGLAPTRVNTGSGAAAGRLRGRLARAVRDLHDLHDLRRQGTRVV